MQHMTPVTWYVTYDTWHVTHGGCEYYLKASAPPALTVWDRQSVEDSEQKDHLINQSINPSINGEGVSKTAPSTQGLLTICKKYLQNRNQDKVGELKLAILVHS